MALEPDYQIVLKEREAIIQPAMTTAAPDVVISITTKGSIGYDYTDKYDLYQANGVRELWYIQLSRKHADFFSLSDEGLYQRIETDNHIFHSKVLSRFRLDTQLLWKTPLPRSRQTISMVEAMLKKDA